VRHGVRVGRVPPAGESIRAWLDASPLDAASLLRAVLDDGDGLTTLYAHLESVAVLDGDDVDAGELVGAAGSTGNSTGPHLHFEVRRDGIPEDPTLDVALP